MIVAVLAMVSVNAQIVSIDKVKLDGDELSASSTNSVRQIERNNEFEVRVEFTALEDAEEVELEATITGYDNDERISDTVYVDEVVEGVTYVRTMTLDFPYDIDWDEDGYTLKVRMDPRQGETVTEYFELLVDPEEHDFVIKDVAFSPGLTVEAGRTLLTTVRIENIGDEDDVDGVKVEVNADALGLSAIDYLDEVEQDDSISSEELYMLIPSTTAAGDYDLDVTVTYDDGRYSETASYTLTVTASTTSVVEEEASKTIITVGPELQDVVAGEGGVVYPLTLTNSEGDAKTYVVSLEGYETWGDVRVDPSNVVVLEAGETEAVYLFVSANEGVEGLQSLVVSVESNGEELEDFVLQANVVAGEGGETTGWDSVKRGLEIGLVVLVILLIILGLIIAVNKLRGNDEDEDDEVGQTYY